MRRMEEQRALVEQPGRAYGPVAKAFVGIMGVLFVVSGFVGLLMGEYFGALSMGALAWACFYALSTGREVHEGAPEPRRLEPCPCCNTPVLDAGWSVQNCLICEWEIGENGDNLGYDLPNARENFRRNGVYYELEDRKHWGAGELTEEEMTLKARIITVLEQLQVSEDRRKSAEFWREFERLESTLHRYRKAQAEHGA